MALLINLQFLFENKLMIKIISCLVLYCTSVPHCVHGWCHSALATIFNWSSGRNRTVHRSLSRRIFSFLLQQPVPFWLLRIKGINFFTNFLSLTFGNLKHLILYIHFIIFSRKLLFVTIKIHRGLIQKLEKKLTEKNEIWTVSH